MAHLVAGGCGEQEISAAAKGTRKLPSHVDHHTRPQAEAHTRTPTARACRPTRVWAGLGGTERVGGDGDYEPVLTGEGVGLGERVGERGGASCTMAQGDVVT